MGRTLMQEEKRLLGARDASKIPDIVKTTSDPEHLFHLLDADNNGYLDKNELRSFLGECPSEQRSEKGEGGETELKTGRRMAVNRKSWAMHHRSSSKHIAASQCGTARKQTASAKPSPFIRARPPVRSHCVDLAHRAEKQARESDPLAAGKGSP